MYLRFSLSALFPHSNPLWHTPLKQFCECLALFWGGHVCVCPLESPPFQAFNIFLFSRLLCIFLFFLLSHPQSELSAFTFVNCFSSGVSWQNVWGPPLMCDLSLSFSLLLVLWGLALRDIVHMSQLSFWFRTHESVPRSFALLLVQFQSNAWPNGRELL